MKNTRHRLLPMLFAAVCLLGAAFGQESSKMEERSAPSSAPANLALKGFDPVAYFDQKEALRGDPAYTYEYGGSTYRFLTAAHRDLFVKNPPQYLPEYGGFCAYGASQGHKAPADPEAWTVIDGKLYLNYNKDVQKRFAKDAPAAIREADANWQKLK